MLAIWVAEASKRRDAAIRPYRAVAIGSMRMKLRRKALTGG
jgi:hypothetical protein